jgi:hypothetical protein
MFFADLQNQERFPTCFPAVSAEGMHREIKYESSKEG